MQDQSDNYIRIRGARTHNLKNINVDLPHLQLTVITGVSGSGKSSLAFDTIHSEGQRRFLENLSPGTRQLFSQMQPADVDDILQEVRLQLWSVDLKKYDASRGKLVPFVVTRIYWEAAGHLRARQKAAQLYDDFVSQAAEEVPQATPEELFAEAEHQELLDEIVSWAREQLPDPLERDSVLAPVDKRTLVEVAKQHSTEPWRVKQARKEGLYSLRKAAPKDPETLLRRRRKACA